MWKVSRTLGEHRESECNLAWGHLEDFLESVIITVLHSFDI